MRDEWSNQRLADVVELIGGGTPKRNHSDYWGGDIPWLSVRDFNNDNRYVYYTEETITEEGVKNSSTKILSPGQIIISARGTVGALAQLVRPMAFNQSCYGINAKDGTFNDYLFYLLKHTVANLQRITHGAVFDTITRETFQHVEIALPSLPEQRAIAHILGSLDDKIELNRQMAQTLESIARAIFKSWFVDFDPVKAKMEGKQPEGMTEEIAALFPDRLVDSELGMIPEGWSPIPLSKMANFLNGLALQKYPPIGKDDLPVLKIAQLRSGKLDYDKLASNEISDKYIVSEGDLIFSWSGSLIVDVWAGPKCALNQHLFKVTPEKWATKGLLWVAIHEHIDNFRAIAAAKAVTMGHIKRSHLNEAMVILPSIEKVQNISGVLDILIQRSTTLKAESNTLINLRDTLLPQLISSKIRLNQPEDAAA